MSSSPSVLKEKHSSASTTCQHCLGKLSAASPQPTPHVAHAQNAEKDGKLEKKSWNELVFEALKDLSLAYGGEREVFTAEEICDRLEQVHGADAPGNNRETRRTLVVLVLSMQKALWRREEGYPPRRQPYTSLESFEEQIKRQRTPSPPPRAPPVPLNAHIPPAFHNHYFPSPPSSPIKWSPCHTPHQLTGYHNRNTSRSGTIADVVAAASVVEAQSTSRIRRGLLFQNMEITNGYKEAYGEGPSNVHFSRYDRHQHQSCYSHTPFQQPSPYPSPKSGRKKTKWRELVNITLRRLYRDNPNRQAFRLKDIADLAEAFWDRLKLGKIKPGNFRASVGAVLSAYPEFTTGVGAGHQGWWSLEDMKDKGSDCGGAPAIPSTPTPSHKFPSSRLVPVMDANGGFFEHHTMTENLSDADDFDDDFFMRQGAVPYTPSSYGPPESILDDEVAEDGNDGKVKKQKKRKSQRMTWKSLLVWIMRDLVNGEPSVNGANENVELQSQNGAQADVKGIWVSMTAIVAEAENRWAEYGPRASMSKYWKPTLRRTLVENPEFKCGSSGYGMNGMWTLAEFLQESGYAMHALDDITMVAPAEDECSTANESIRMHLSSEESETDCDSDTHGESKNSLHTKRMQNYPVYSSTPAQQNNMSLEHKENDAIITLTSLFQHHTPEVHQYPTAADSNSESEEISESSSDDDSSDATSDDERPETPSPMDVNNVPSRTIVGGRGRGGQNRISSRNSWGQECENGGRDTRMDEPGLPSPRGKKRKSEMTTESDEKNGAEEVKRIKLLGSTQSGRLPPKRTISSEKPTTPSKSLKAKQPAPAGAKRNTTWTNALLYTFEELHKMNPGRTCFHFTEIYHWVDQKWHELFPDRIKNETWQRTISGRLSDIPNFVRTASAYPGWWKLRGNPDQFGDISDYSAPFPVYSVNKPRSRSNSSDSSVTPTESAT